MLSILGLSHGPHLQSIHQFFNRADVKSGPESITATLVAEAFILHGRSLLASIKRSNGEDEPTSAMDAQAEHDIYHSFTDIVAGKTSLLISHRFSTVRMADLIAVLEDGKITEYGSHDELMSKGGTYARLYNMQADRYR